MPGQQNKAKSAAAKAAKPVEAKSLLKSALLINALSVKGGATTEVLCSITGWQPHPVRAALTGLRKKGHTVMRARTAGGRDRLYHHTVPEAAV